MINTNMLAFMLCRIPPDQGIPEPVPEIPMKLIANITDRKPRSDYERFLHICRLSLGFQIYPYKSELLVE
jgi:hypothetical protein